MPVKRNHRRAAPMTGSVENRIWHQLTSALDTAARLLPAFESCL